MKEFSYTLHRLSWREIEITIRYCPDSFASYAHIEIESACRSPLPISETGYRSHFTRREQVEEAGGPVAFIEAILDECAGDKGWKAAEAARKQLSLF